MQIDMNQAEKDMRHFHVPPSPAVLLEIQQLAASGHADAEDYAHSISKDVALTGMLLKTINSPLFALTRKILDVEQAIVLLGIARVEKLVTYIELRRALTGKACISLEKFWDNTMDLASLMLMLPKFLKINSPAIKEDCFTIGLFRDCGIPLMAMRFDDYRQVLIEANSHPEVVFTDFEEKPYQTNHAVVGYFLARSWHLPDLICELILRHHDTTLMHDKAVSEWHQDLYAMSKIAANIHSHIRYGDPSSEWLLDQDVAMARFNLSDMDYRDLQQDVTEEFQVRFSA